MQQNKTFNKMTRKFGGFTPISTAIVNQSIHSEFQAIDRQRGKVGCLTGIPVGLFIRGAILATCVSVGVVKDRVWRYTKKVWCKYHQVYHTRTVHPGHLLAGLGGGLGAPIGGFLSGIVAGGGAVELHAFLKRRKLKPADADATPEQALAALLDAAPSISDEHLQPAVDAMSYRELVQLEKGLGIQCLCSLVLEGSVSERSLWAWRLVSDMRNTPDATEFQGYMTDHAEQLSDAATQVPGFMQHLSTATLAHLDKLQTTDTEAAPIRAAIQAIIARHYCPEEGSSDVELILEEDELTVDVELLRLHRTFLKGLAELAEDDDGEIDLTEEPEQLQQRFVEELEAEELLTEVYPATQIATLTSARG